MNKKVLLKRYYSLLWGVLIASFIVGFIALQLFRELNNLRIETIEKQIEIIELKRQLMICESEKESLNYRIHNLKVLEIKDR